MSPQINGEAQQDVPIIRDLNDLPPGAQRMDVKYGGPKQPKSGEYTPEMMAAMGGSPMGEKHLVASKPMPDLNPAASAFAPLNLNPRATGMPGAGGPKAKRPKKHKKADLKFVKCPACQEAAKFFHGKAVAVREAQGARLTEDILVKIAQEVCDQRSPTGQEFLEARRFRPTKEGAVTIAKRLRGETGCGDDCLLLAEACEVSWADVELDAAETLWRGVPEPSALAEEVCSDACGSTAPPLPVKHWLLKRAEKQRKRKAKKAEKDEL